MKKTMEKKTSDKLNNDPHRVANYEGWVEDMAMNEDKIFLDQLLDKICSPREQDIIRRFYGFGAPRQTLYEIAKDYNFTHDRARMIRVNGVRKIKDFVFYGRQYRSIISWQNQLSQLRS